MTHYPPKYLKRAHLHRKTSEINWRLYRPTCFKETVFLRLNKQLADILVSLQ